MAGSRGKHLKFAAIGLLLCAALLALFLSAYSYYSEENQAVRQARYEDLKAIAELKANQIANWRQERLADARVYTSGLLRNLTAVWLAKPTDAVAKETLFSRLKAVGEHKSLQNLLVTDGQGRVLISLRPQLTELEPSTKALAVQAFGENRSIFGDFFRCPHSKEVFIDVAAPLLNDSGQAIAVLVFRNDPGKILFPLIHSWPTSSKSAETLLVRREGNEAVYINPLRFAPIPSLKHRLPLSRTDVPAVQALLGKTGLTTGIDYSGRQVLAYLLPIPDSQWIMVAKVNEDEVLSEVTLHTRVFSASLIVSLAVLAVLFLAGLSFRRQKLLAALLASEKEQHATQEALLASEARNSALFANSPDALFVVRTDGALLEANQAAVARYGYTHEEFLAMRVFDLYPEGDESHTLAPDRLKLAASQGIRFETRHLRKDGSITWVEVHSRPLLFEQKPCVLSAVRDISDRKRSEEALYHNELNLRTVFDAVTDMIALLDTKGNFLLYNPAVAEHFRRFHNTDELIGKSILDLTSEGVRESRKAHFLSVVQSGEPLIFEDFSSGAYWQNHIYGVRDKSGQVQRMVVISRDITAFVQSQQALSASEERFRRLIDCAPEAIFVQTESRFRFLNPAALRLFGVSEPAELLGERIVDHFHPDFRSLVGERIQALNERRQTIPHIEEKILRGDGTSVEVEVSAVPLLYEGQNGALVFLRDITERRQAERERLHLEEQFRQAQKMEAIGRLAGGVAHDFNNQLTGILGNVELAMNDLAKSDPLFETLGEIQHAASSAAAVTRQLLIFSRKQISEPKVIDLNELVETMQRMLGRLIGEHITLRAILKRPLDRVRVDINQIEQLLVNLAVNARDAMPDGGLLTIETDELTLGSDYSESHPHTLPGRYVVLTVSDTGCGMSAATKSMIFEPFFTTKAKEKGTGLGLASVYGTVKQAGGSIEVYSEVGQGSSFKIYLPSLDEKAESVRHVSAQRPLSGGTETIFLVEDEDVVRNLAYKLLKRLGYDVSVFANGASALEAAETQTERIALLITDVVMPGINGRALATAFKVGHPESAVLYTSGYTENVIVHQGVLEEGIHFLGKPYSPLSMAEKIREILDPPLPDELLAPSAKSDC